MERRARKWSGFTCKRASEDTTLPRYIGLLKKEEEEGEIAIFYFARRVRKIALYIYIAILYTRSIGNQP